MSKSRQSSVRPLVISVDSYEDRVLTGRLWYGGDGSEKQFTGLMQLLLLTEEVLGASQPPAEDRCKSFVRPDAAQVARELTQTAEPTRGALATFRLLVLFLQYTSWQGLLTWVEAGEEESFRSVLELANLLDSALTCAGEQKAQ